MEYNFKKIEKKWQKLWEERKTNKVSIVKSIPKYYVLDMFPYPSGAGLHVGHPLGYIASDIFARYKRHKGFNVLHPMGFDAYGLPAEQYAIQTGQHPAVTTENNIKKYKKQLQKIGFCFDWSREIRTCDPGYYKWTQWIFIQLFNSWYDKRLNKAVSIETLISTFEKEGNQNVIPENKEVDLFSAQEWKAMGEKAQQKILLDYRLAYLSFADVNWCPELGTVLANDEVKEGLSVRGGHPVVKKPMKQWFMRISPYSQRLLDELENLDWTDSLKEIQRNWIGRSEGALISFNVVSKDSTKTPVAIPFFTTRPDTIFGATFMVLAPEHELVEKLTTPDNKEKVFAYVEYARGRSDRERITEVKTITGQNTGSYAYNPFTEENIPIYVSEYVLSGYGTGAIMAVPAHDSRDYDFAKEYDLKIRKVIEGGDDTEGSYDDPQGIVINSGFITGLSVPEAVKLMIDKCQEMGIGKGQVNYKLRDAVFSRQRYWGEPFPVYYKDEIPYVMDEDKLPLELPEVQSYKPSEKGEAPLSKAENWKTEDGYPIEIDTMPGYAGSSWYFLRYMDPFNDKEFVSKEAQEYWGKVDLYIGGAEHATGHLIYARFWTHFLFDLGYLTIKEPFQKLINQGMILAYSYQIYIHKSKKVAISSDIYDCWWSGVKSFTQPIKEVIAKASNDYPNKCDEFRPFQVPAKFVNNDILDEKAFKNEKGFEEFKDFELIRNDKNDFRCSPVIDKMSKSKGNVIIPDETIDQYGADTFRIYEMFLGPIEQHKPWDTDSIDGSFRFVNRFWRLFFNDAGEFTLTPEQPTKEELKTLHKTIKKVTSDIERLSFNTAISAMMVCTNELIAFKCQKEAVLKPLIVLISPFAPFMAEELWELAGESGSVSLAPFPEYDESYLKEALITYPIAINGKTRTKIELSLELKKDDIEKEVLKLESLKKWFDGKKPKKFIIVPGRIINVVI